MYDTRSSFFSNIPPVVKNLLIINTLIFLLMALMPAADHWFNRYLALYYFTSPGFEPYQLLTYMFLHGNFMHLFFNMFALFMFGRTIEMSMGSARFLFYYLTCGICAALVQMGVFAIYVHHIEGLLQLPPDALEQIINDGFVHLQNHQNYTDPNVDALNAFVNMPMVGASGAIYGILLAFGFLFPNVGIYLFFVPVPIKAKWLVLGYFVIELIYGITGSADGVAHFAHLGGMIFGFLLLWYWKRKGVFNNGWFF